MLRILEILTQSDQAFARALIHEEMKIPNSHVEVISLDASNPNYEELLRQIFEADAVHVW